MAYHETRRLMVRLERDCQRDPRRYLRTVIALGLAGYAFPAAMLVVSLGLTALMVMCFAHGHIAAGLCLFGLPLGMVVWVAAKALGVVRADRAEGVPLTQQQGRRLLEITAGLCRALRAPRMRGVFLTGELEVRVVQSPLASMVGLPRNRLVIGLPLLLSLSPEETTAVIAHELGHFSRLHSGFAVWVYSLRTIWLRLLAHLLRRDDNGTYPLRRFAEWYSPLLNAYTYVLARRHELDTDRLAAKLAKAENLARALVRLRLAAAWLDQRFWPDWRATARRDSRPPEHVYAALGQSVTGMPENPAELLPLLGPAEQVSGVPDNAHPSLLERLQALKQPLAPPGLFKRSAAHEFLGQALGEVESGLSSAWGAQNEQEWELGRAEAEEERRRMNILDAKHAAGALTQEEAWERAWILQKEGRAADFEHAAQEIIAHGPPFAPVLYALGRALLARGDEHGLAYLDRAMEVGESGGYEACQAAQAFLSARGRADDAQRYGRKAVEFLTLMERARAERQAFHPGDPVEPHGLRQDTVQSIKTQVAVVPQVLDAYLVRRRVSRMRDQPFYVMGVYMEWQWWRLPGQQAHDLCGQLKRTVELPGDWFCVVMNRLTPGFQQRFKAVAGEPVYSRAEREMGAGA